MHADPGALAPTSAPPAGRQAAGGSWIVSPAFDLLFIANLGWLLALVPWFVAPEGTVHLQFWQIYFLTTPHRWITLALVAFDPDRREGRGVLFIALAASAFVLVLALTLINEGKYFCYLVVADYLWNAWHFASQHHGVLRVYGRKVGGGWPRLERWGLRVFIFYVLALTAGWTTGWLEDHPYLVLALSVADWAILSMPVVLLETALLSRRPSSLPKMIYLASVCGLYSALLLALHFRSSVLVSSLAVATAAFHAIEYLALVTSYAWRREQSGATGLFQAMAARWLWLLAAFVGILGLSDFLLEQDRALAEWWFALNLWAAFLHYTYDGMIWKLRRPETARALGIDVPNAAAPVSTAIQARRPAMAVKEVGS